MSHRMLAASWLALAMTGVMEFKPIHDTDIFWQIKLGQIAIEEGRIPEQDRFTYTHRGEPAPAIGWLAQIFYASLHDVGGWHLARGVHNVAFVGALLVAAATCRGDATSPLGVSVAMLVGFYVSLSNSDLRPQSLGLLAFAALLLLARSRLSWKIKLLIAGPLLVAWQNIHPSVVVGAAALAGLAAADFLDRSGKRRDCWQLVALALMAMTAQFATPVGGRIFGVSRSNLLIGRDVLRIAEWLPPWEPDVAGLVIPYWAVFPISLIAIVYFWHRVPARDRGLFVVMTCMTLFATRFIIFWAVALVPFWAQVVERVVPRRLFAWARRPGEHREDSVRSVIGLIVGAAIVLGLHPVRFHPIFEDTIPVDGVLALRGQLPGKARIFNEYYWAGPLILDGGRKWEVAVDGRLYLFPDPREWRALEGARAGRVPLEELERTHQPDAFFLARGNDHALVDSLLKSPRWRTCYNTPTCVAFVRAR